MNGQAEAMARAKKQARHIIVNDVAYSWRATGDDGNIALNIWPTILDGPPIWASFNYHETWVPDGPGRYSCGNDQIVITNRLVRRVILHALGRLAYDPARKGKQIRIFRVDQLIDISDAIRAG